MKKKQTYKSSLTKNGYKLLLKLFNPTSNSARVRKLQQHKHKQLRPQQLQLLRPFRWDLTWGLGWFSCCCCVSEKVFASEHYSTQLNDAKLKLSQVTKIPKTQHSIAWHNIFWTFSFMSYMICVQFRTEVESGKAKASGVAFLSFDEPKHMLTFFRMFFNCSALKDIERNLPFGGTLGTFNRRKVANLKKKLWGSGTHTHTHTHTTTTTNTTHTHTHTHTH